MPAIEEKVLAEQLVLGDDEDSEIAKEFICKICLSHVVGNGPKLTRCSHIFCGDCVAEWFAACPSNQTWAQRARSGGSIPCPVCKEPLRKEDLHSVCEDGDHESVLLHQLLSSVNIVCANSARCTKQGRCNWTGTYGEYQSHIACCTNEYMECYEVKTNNATEVQASPEELDDKQEAASSASDGEDEESRSTRFSSGNEAELLSDSDGLSSSERLANIDESARFSEEEEHNNPGDDGSSQQQPVEQAPLLGGEVNTKDMSLNDLIGALVTLKTREYEACGGSDAVKQAPAAPLTPECTGASGILDAQEDKQPQEEEKPEPKTKAKAKAKKNAKSANKAQPAASAKAQIASAQAAHMMQQWQAAQAMQWQQAAHLAQLRQVAQWHCAAQAAQWQAHAQLMQAAQVAAAKGGYGATKRPAA